MKKKVKQERKNKKNEKETETKKREIKYNRKPKKNQKETIQEKNPVQGTFWKVPKTGLDALCVGRPISVVRCAAPVRSLNSLPQRAANRIFHFRPHAPFLHPTEYTIKPPLIHRIENS